MIDYNVDTENGMAIPKKVSSNNRSALFDTNQQWLISSILRVASPDSHGMFTG